MIIDIDLLHEIFGIHLVLGTLGAYITIAKPSRNLKELLSGITCIFLLPVVVTGFIEWLSSDFTTMSSYKQLVVEQVAATTAVASISMLIFIVSFYPSTKREYDKVFSDKLDFLTYMYHGHMYLKKVIRGDLSRNHQNSNFDSSGYMMFGEEEVDKYRNETLQKDLESSSDLVEDLMVSNKTISDKLERMNKELHRMAREEADELISDFRSLSDQLTQIGNLKISDYSSSSISELRILEEEFTRAKATMLLTSFMNFYFEKGSRNYRFTIRKLNFIERTMESTIALCDQDNNEAGPIPLDSPNLIIRSHETDCPMIFSENSEHHYDTGNGGLNNGRYDDYLTYTFASVEVGSETLPLLSLCIDVQGTENAGQLKEIKKSGILDVLTDKLDDFIDRSALDIFYSVDRDFPEDQIIL